MSRCAISQILLSPFEGDFRIVFFQPIYELYNLNIVFDKSSIICHDVAQKRAASTALFLYGFHNCHLHSLQTSLRERVAINLYYTAIYKCEYYAMIFDDLDL